MRLPWGNTGSDPEWVVHEVWKEPLYWTLMINSSSHFTQQDFLQHKADKQRDLFTTIISNEVSEFWHYEHDNNLRRNGMNFKLKAESWEVKVKKVAILK